MVEYGLNENSISYQKHEKNAPEPVLVIDSWTGKNAVFKSVVDTSAKLNLSSRAIYAAIKRGSLVAGRFYFDYLSESNHRSDLFIEKQQKSTKERVRELEEKVEYLEMVLNKILDEEALFK